MRWLTRLVTRLDGTVLDPFAGSGSTGIACVLEGFDFIGIEKQGPEYVKANPDADDYVSIMRARIAHAETHPWDYDPDIPEPKKGNEPIPGQMEML